MQRGALRADLLGVTTTSSSEEVDLRRAVAALQLVGAPREERFDRITRTAQRVLGTPLAFLNLVDGEDLWITSCVGFDGRRVARRVALCGHTLATGAALFVDDTLLDARFRSNPLVTGPPHARAYGGQPLSGPTGHVVGTLCVLDHRPRTWSDGDRRALSDLATWAEAELARGDVARRLEEGEAVRRQHAQVLRSAGQGILGVGPDGVVVVANPAAEQLTGWATPGLAGRPLHATLHPRTENGALCLDPLCPLRVGGARALDATPADGTALRLREALWHRDGWAFPAQVTVAPLVGATMAGGAVVVFDDISDQLAVDRMKNEFIAVVSHELRTPLTSLRGSLGLLAAGIVGDLSPEGQHMTSVAVASTDRLVRLVDDILDLERLVSGQVALQRREHELADVVRTAVESVAGTAAEAGVALRAEVGPGTAWLDGDRVVQVLVNLLANAVKFSPRGGTVTVRSEVADDDVVLEVEDSGRGIPADRLDAVFERFAQVDSSDSREHGGTGLGLTIARNVVEAHGGTIAVRSTVGSGTTFTVTLPQRAPLSPPRPGGRRLEDPEERT